MGPESGQLACVLNLERARRRLARRNCVKVCLAQLLQWRSLQAPPVEVKLRSGPIFSESNAHTTKAGCFMPFSLFWDLKVRCWQLNALNGDVAELWNFGDVCRPEFLEFGAETWI